MESIVTRTSRRPASLHLLVSGVLAGLLGGELFMGVGLWRHGADLLRGAPSAAFAAWVIVRSVAVYGLLGAVFGLFLAAPLVLIARLWRRLSTYVGPIVLAVTIAGTIFAYLSSRWQLEVLAGLPFENPERVRL